MVDYFEGLNFVVWETKIISWVYFLWHILITKSSGYFHQWDPWRLPTTHCAFVRIVICTGTYLKLNYVKCWAAELVTTDYYLQGTYIYTVQTCEYLYHTFSLNCSKIIAINILAANTHLHWGSSSILVLGKIENVFFASAIIYWAYWQDVSTSSPWS